jgi:hypothetical protein
VIAGCRRPAPDVEAIGGFDDRARSSRVRLFDRNPDPVALGQRPGPLEITCGGRPARYRSPSKAAVQAAVTGVGVMRQRHVGLAAAEAIGHEGLF